jgi:hypothetical protein
MMSDIQEKVARAIYEAWWHEVEGFQGDPNYGSCAGLWKNWEPAGVTVITVFLEAAAEQGWHMRPDMATEKMWRAGKREPFLESDLSTGHPEKLYRAMLEAAPKFEWKSDT